MSEFRASNSASTSPEMLKDSPGAILRRCREFHGITLEEASETTKIGISHLKALEDDQIREFANQAYLKGFLRIYATYLGLNSDDVARMYDKLFGVPSAKADTARSSTDSSRPRHRFFPLKKLLFPALLLALILITATFFKLPPAPLVRQPQPAAVALPPVQISAVQMVQSSVRVRKVERDSLLPNSEKHSAELQNTEKPATSKRSTEVTRGFILKIMVTQNGTLTATVDGSGAQRYELAIGDIIEWKAGKKVTLELSNAGGVEVELNGTPYKPLGPLGKPAYIELDADGVK